MKKKKMREVSKRKVNLKFLLIIFTLIPVFFSGLFQGGYFTWEAYGTFLLSLPAIFLFFYLKIVNKESIVKSGADKGLFIFLAVAFLSLFFTVYFHATLTEFYKVLIYVVLFYIILNSVTTQKDLNFVLNSVLVLSLILALLGIFAYFGYKFHLTGAFFDFLSRRGLTQGARISSTLQYANTFAAFLILPIFISFSYFVHHKRNFLKIIYGIFTLLFLFALLLTESRGGIIAFFAVLVLYFILTQGKDRKQGLMYLAVLIGVFAVSAIFKKDLVLLLLQGVANRLKELFAFLGGAQNLSLGARETMVRDSLKILKDHPVFGTGNGTYQYVYAKYRSIYFFSKFPHSIFFQVLDELGIAGAVAFVYMLYSLFKKGFLVLKRNYNILFVGLYAGLAGILLHAFVDFDWSLMFMPLLFFFGFGLLISQGKKEYFTFKCPLLEKRKKSLKEVKSYKVKTNDGKKVTALTIVTVILFLLFLFPFIAARGNFNAKATTGRVSWQETVNQYKSSIVFDPLAAEYHYDLAHFNFEILIPSAPDPTQFVNEAINEYNAAIKHCPEFFLYHFELARLYLQTGNEKAINEFTKAVELNPMDAGGHASLGFAYLRLKQDTVMSKIQFEEALRLDPKNADAYLGFGNLYEELGNIEKAIENYELAIKYNSKNAYAYYRLGVIYKDEGKLPEAVHNLFYALQYNPNLKEAQTEYEKFAPIITIVNPRAKEDIKVGAAYEIKWLPSNANNIEYYNIVLIPGKGETITIASGLAKDVFSYRYRLPADLEIGEYRIRIYAMAPKFMQKKFGNWLSYKEVVINITH